MEINIYDEIILGDLNEDLIYLVKYYNQFNPEKSVHEFWSANDHDSLKSAVKNKLRVDFDNRLWESVESDDYADFESAFENDWGNWIKFFKFDDEDLKGIESANFVYLVKYYNNYQPENSSHEFWIADNDMHLKQLVKLHLQNEFNVGNWSSVEEDDYDNFEEAFENDWNNWIKYFEVGNIVK